MGVVCGYYDTYDWDFRCSIAHARRYTHDLSTALANRFPTSVTFAAEKLIERDYGRCIGKEEVMRQHKELHVNTRSLQKVAKQRKNVTSNLRNHEERIKDR